MAKSRTAQFVAFYRALETSETARTPLFRDPLAASFLTGYLRVALQAALVPPLRAAIVRYADYRAPGARTSTIGRTRFIDDVIRDRVAGGAEQLVLLGAGFDCRAYRLPELRSVRVFEVDQPEMIAIRRAHLVRATRLARDVTSVAIDFTRDDLRARLAESGFDERARTVFVWEGVTNYLPEAAVAEVLRFVGSCLPGSSLVVTYVHRGVLDGSVQFEGADQLLRNLRELGEPWRFGLLPDETRAFLGRFGIQLMDELGADEYRGRYLGTSSADLRGYVFYRVAVGEIAPARAAPAGGRSPDAARDQR